MLLVNEVWTVAVCPGSKVTELGPAVNPKLDEATIAKEVDEVVFRPSTVTVTGPVEAPGGIRNERLFPLKAETGAPIVPPPCWFRETCGVNEACANPLPLRVISVPIGAEPGVNPVMEAGVIRLTLIDCVLVFPATSVACTAMEFDPALSVIAHVNVPL